MDRSLVGDRALCASSEKGSDKGHAGSLAICGSTADHLDPVTVTVEGHFSEALKVE